MSSPEYETLDFEALPGKTEVGGVKHNKSMGLETDNPLFERQTSPSEATEPAATMANDLLIQPDKDSKAATTNADSSALDLSFGVPVEDQSIWVDLYQSLVDVFFPRKLPPLELTSKPIPVLDPMAVKRNPWAVGASIVLNAGILALLLVAVVKPMIEKAKQPVVVTPVDLTDYKAPQAAAPAGGGGGSPDKIEAIKGRIPPRAETPQITAKLEPPTPTINVQNDIVIPDNPTLPNFGVSNSTNVKLASGGNGRGIGMGNGNGSGLGDGSGGGTGGGVYKPGGDVSYPILLNEVQAEFSDEARRNKYQGVVLINILVDAQGKPQNPRVVRALGEGLDEKAIEAVMKYKFKPCMKDRRPVPCSVPIEVDFNLY
ncbi:MAG: energy transducer TonB [Terracidiphilus sp.]